jgi:hypothetical protein
VIPRRRFHRFAFAAAGIYNIAWGLLAVASPNWFFSFTGMAPINHPEIFACLGMVIGLYGVLYLEVARRPEHGFLPAAIGFVGKALGPVGALVLVLKHEWPVSALVLNVTNDFIWWIPFVLYLKDSWPFFAETLQTGGQA